MPEDCEVTDLGRLQCDRRAKGMELMMLARLRMRSVCACMNGSACVYVVRGLA